MHLSQEHFGFICVVNNCLSDISLRTSFMRSEVKMLSLSLKVLVGKSTLENTSSKASAALSVLKIVSEYGQRNCLRVLCNKVYYCHNIFVTVVLYWRDGDLSVQLQHGEMLHPLLASPPGELLSPLL